MGKRSFFCANGKTPCDEQCSECSMLQDDKARSYWIYVLLLAGFTLYLIVVIIIAIRIVDIYLNANN